MLTLKKSKLKAFDRQIALLDYQGIKPNLLGIPISMRTTILTNMIKRWRNKIKKTI
jgi:hypothetical protein